MDFGHDCTTLEYTSKNTIKLYISVGGLHSTWIISQERNTGTGLKPKETVCAMF